MSSPWARSAVWKFWLIGGMLVLAVGCSKKGPTEKLVPVSGKVTLDAKPLPLGQVILTPDKGNPTKSAPVGMIGDDGSYSINTGGYPGAPLGWYKVSINPQGMPKEMPKTGEIPKPANVPQKYQKAASTDLSIEVTESPKPEGYDIKIKPDGKSKATPPD